MTDYYITFYTKLSAKSEKDLFEKAEKVAETLSKCLKKKVNSHGYVPITKKDVVDIQTKLGD